VCGEIERFHAESNARETSLKAGRLGKSEVKELKRGGSVKPLKKQI
jgi:hypothetical protein